MLARNFITERLENSKNMFRELITKRKKRNLICFTSPNSLISEQFKTIRTNIKILLGEQKGQILLVTSPLVEEGKSTMLANLAVSLAQNKSKVLVVDTNLRSPYIHSIFKLQNEEGLTTILENEVNLAEIIRFTGISGLDVLTSGPVTTGPAEMINSKKFENLLSIVRESYDIVLVDSPSLIHSSETRIVAGLSDGVILVINKGKTLLDKAKESKKILDFANANLIGTIINEK